MEDSSIVDLYLARDERAICETDGKYGKKLYSISRRITENGADAEECVSDTYLGAWTRIPPHEPRTYFFAFLARIVRAASIDRCRKSMRQKRTAHVEELTKELEECIAAPDDLACRLDDCGCAERLSRHTYARDAADLSAAVLVCRQHPRPGDPLRLYQGQGQDAPVPNPRTPARLS